MKKPITLLAAGLFAGSFSFSALATEIIFDDPTDPINGSEIKQPEIEYTDFFVRAGYSTSNLCCGINFVRSDIETMKPAEPNEDPLPVRVWRDTDPANGGLGVDSGLADGDTDNFEGSLNNNANTDEILFFDFKGMVTLMEVWLNAGDEASGTSHQDKFSSDATDVFDIFYSMNGEDYFSIYGANTKPTDGELLALTGDNLVNASYFAVAHVGPTDSVGGYIEKIKYASVPEPATLGLMGLGLLGLGVLRRKKAV
ncbi:hypothetical protein ACP86_00125 [Marinobacter sp. CP1]|jgi:hypothetical protein|uniref:PEP-CTERM sorting domain-containing protein n=1 Tax=unclassified Marinobacter TaxID=83889 RepID=UPI00069FEE32|nr:MULTISPECIES: PEP-CTERM sorting domain-containing protein [unclassified Marinobacter]AKV94706.1 hypothetical protein ACP86_00125 [Marinobacter sp. CP1]